MAVIVENLKEGLIEAVVHPTEDVVDEVEVVIVVANAVIQTLEGETANLDNLRNHHHAQMEAAKISGFITFKKILITLCQFSILT